LNTISPESVDNQRSKFEDHRPAGRTWDGAKTQALCAPRWAPVKLSWFWNSGCIPNCPSASSSFSSVWVPGPVGPACFCSVSPASCSSPLCLSLHCFALHCFAPPCYGGVTKNDKPVKETASVLSATALLTKLTDWETSQYNTYHFKETLTNC